MALDGERQVVSGNGLPDHPTGSFPVERYSNAFALDPNPNSIAAQRVTVNVATAPALAAQATCLPMGPVGVMLSAAVFFNTLDAAGLDAVRDLCGGPPPGDRPLPLARELLVLRRLRPVWCARRVS
ncbi:MAG: hypothetical protein EXR52_00260 [Dehalococcoidia bacterium]|nr:hypothetical protein [Dehalococcoidia bacterium]